MLFKFCDSIFCVCCGYEIIVRHFLFKLPSIKQDILKQIGAEGTDVSRFKGLGEMDTEELAETTMDPETRTLLRVNMNDDDRADLDVTFTTLMGDQVEPRREFIEENAKYVTNLDV